MGFTASMLERAVPHKSRLIHNVKLATQQTAFHGTSTIIEPYLAPSMFAFDLDPAPVAYTLLEGLDIDRTYRLPDDMLTATDRATMHASVEARVPFITREVAEFAAGLDETHLVSTFKQKELLRK